MSGILYVVGTPIGNLGDFSPRAVQCFSEVDFIAAEDTRVTVKLLNHFNIKKPLVSYHEHNRYEQGEQIVQRLQAGESCALVSDAGMPAISDPGVVLVDKCHENGITVASVPGPCALVTALAISGLDNRRFTFEGFLTGNKPKRREHLAELIGEKKTMVFYEAPHKLAATLRDLYEVLGERRIALVKELTKIYESVERTSLSAAVEKYQGQKLKGEYVIIIEPPQEEGQKECSVEEAAEYAEQLMEDEGLTTAEAAKRAAKQFNLKKGDIYKLLVE